jgi:tetratricopeptide (TPR) repeat protein
MQSRRILSALFATTLIAAPLAADPGGHGRGGHAGHRHAPHGTVVRAGIGVGFPSYYSVRYRSNYSCYPPAIQPYYAWSGPGYYGLGYGYGYGYSAVLGYGWNYFGVGTGTPWGYVPGIDYYDPPAPRNNTIVVLPPLAAADAGGGRNAARADNDDDAVVPQRRAADDPPLVLKPRGRVSLPAARERCRRYVEIGDHHFSRQNYESALQQYQQASAAAPDLGMPLFRQALAYVATRRYDAALNACRKGIRVEPEFVRTPFSLDSVYGLDDAAKNSHLELLAGRALDQPRDATPIILLGVMQLLNADRDRAEKFLRAALPLAGAKDELVTMLLKGLHDEVPVAAENDT